jgi:hypothetical protein
MSCKKSPRPLPTTIRCFSNTLSFAAWTLEGAGSSQRFIILHGGTKGVGESATVGAPPAIANAVMDALAHLGVTNIDIPMTPPKVWAVLKEKGVAL